MPTSLGQSIIPISGSGSGGGSPGTFLVSKSGFKLPVDFAGNPKKATVVFATPFADASYSVHIDGIAVANWQYHPTPEDRTASGFVINLGSGNIARLDRATWTATKHGEST